MVGIRRNSFNVVEQTAFSAVNTFPWWVILRIKWLTRLIRVNWLSGGCHLQSGWLHSCGRQRADTPNYESNSVAGPTQDPALAGNMKGITEMRYCRSSTSPRRIPRYIGRGVEVLGLVEAVAVK
jgi:hypothetical protein